MRSSWSGQAFYNTISPKITDLIEYNTNGWPSSMSDDSGEQILSSAWETIYLPTSNLLASQVHANMTYSIHNPRLDMICCAQHLNKDTLFLWLVYWLSKNLKYNVELRSSEHDNDI